MTLVVLAGMASAALPDPEHLEQTYPHRDAFHDLHLGGASGPPPPSAPEASSSWDIGQYVAHVRIDPDHEIVTGRMTITASRRPDMPEGDLIFHYTGGGLGTVTVDSVVVEPVAGDGVWHVTPAGPDTTVVIDWVHEGSSPDFGIRFDPGITWSVDEPDMARTWMPVYDEPWDKALWAWEIEAPQGLVVAANGTQECYDPGAGQCVEPGAPESDGRTFDTWRFSLDQPLATYLAVLHVSDYEVFELGGDIPVTIWANPVLEAAIDDAFGNTPDMITFLSEAYGAYPWERYGNAVVPFGGAMENTTCTSFGDVYVGENAELVNVHELAHHWFGDDVTLADWRDIWLNEGFASYTEALWYERSYGQEGLTAYLDWQRDTYYQGRDGEGDPPLYDPGSLFGVTVYEKGSWVVHMLRGLVGDDAFFLALQRYTEQYGYANASTSEFEQSFEESTGTDLSWFFDGYVYGTGEPTLSFGYEAVDGGVVVAIEGDTEMPLPVPLRVFQADGRAFDTKVTLSAGSVCALLSAADAVSEVELDPDLWLLTRDRRALDSTATAACVASLQDTASIDTGAPDRPGSDPGGADCGCDSAGSGALGGMWVLGAGVGLWRRRR